MKEYVVTTALWKFFAIQLSEIFNQTSLMAFLNITHDNISLVMPEVLEKVEQN